MGPRDSLNSSQSLHLLTSCKYVDQLLSEIEGILSASRSKSPFPKYRGDLSPVQIKVIQDYIARIRAQMVHVLKSQAINLPEAPFETRRTIWVNLEFADIALDECRPAVMRGYGELPASLVPELNGLVQEMKGVIRRLSTYLAQDNDLEGRLQRLGRTTGELELLKTLERLISEHGLVEFRPALEIILDRLESTSFQIAVFGRVSSGKSSLLNHILETSVLPVGVNPITAVPTRIVHGPQPGLTVTCAGRAAERVDLARLPEFVSEQFNPGNARHVTRIVAELPARRLRDGVIFVDTPGLGSLATAGAAETMAYLPSCDFGVVLIAAGSTLNQEDLATIQSLYQAAIPACVLLSKIDLLREEDRPKVIDYTTSQIASQLNLKLSVHPVSTDARYSTLVDEWFEREIQPLCDRHQELAQESIRRKIGALQEGVEGALKLRLEMPEKKPEEESKRIEVADVALRRATGKFEEVNTLCLRAADQVRKLGYVAVQRTAAEIVEGWFLKDGSPVDDARSITLRHLSQTAAEGANAIFERLRALAGELSQAVTDAAEALGSAPPPGEEALGSAVKEMPRFDPGPLQIALKKDIFRRLGRGLAKRRLERILIDQIGEPVDEAFHNYGRLLESWIRRTLAELRRQFDARADEYRARLERLNGARGVGALESEGVRQSLDVLSQFRVAEAVPAGRGSR